MIPKEPLCVYCFCHREVGPRLVLFPLLSSFEVLCVGLLYFSLNLVHDTLEPSPCPVYCDPDHHPSVHCRSTFSTVNWSLLLLVLIVSSVLPSFTRTPVSVVFTSPYVHGPCRPYVPTDSLTPPSATLGRLHSLLSTCR